MEIGGFSTVPVPHTLHDPGGFNTVPVPHTPYDPGGPFIGQRTHTDSKNQEGGLI